MGWAEKLDQMYAKKYPNVSTEILRAAISGEEEARTQVYEHYNRRVSGYFYRADIPFDDIEACNQDVWERVFRNLPNFEIQEDTPFNHWLFMIARSVKIDFIRKWHAPKRVAAEQIEISSTHPYSRPEEVVEIMELFDAIRGQVEVMTPFQASAFYNRYILDLNHLSSAHILNTSEQNARQLASRGLNKIRMGLKREGLS